MALSQWLITIRKSRVKEKCTIEEIERAFILYIRKITGISRQIVDVDRGYHNHGKHHQLHGHYTFWVQEDIELYNYYIRSMGIFIYVGRCVTQYNDSHRVRRYIHTDDWESPYRLDQILLENYYRYTYYDGY